MGQGRQADSGAVGEGVHMSVSKKQRSIRLSNGPLKILAQVAPNMTVVEHGDLTILYSYETPVALLAPSGGYMTEKKWSTTTSKHIGKFFAAYGYDKRGAGKLPQEDIEAIARAGAEGKHFPINVDPTPAEMRDVVGRLTRQRGNRPRRTQRRQRLIRDVQFFRREGGGIVGQATKGALDLARAEREMQRRGWVVTWEDDQDADLSWMDDKERERPHEVYVAVLWNTDPEPGYMGRHHMKATALASLGGIVDPSREYRRVVEAELASEALSNV
jgi:hypothetical protein